MQNKFIVPATLGVLLTAGCGSGLSGDYGGADCPYQKMTFKGGGAVYLTLMGTELSGEYTVDGDKVSISGGQAGMVFTKKGDTLESSVMGMRFACRKL